MNTEHRFLTIREVARTGLLSEHVLRMRLRQNRLPGFYVGTSGTRYLVDYAALVEMLHKEARANAPVSAALLDNAGNAGEKCL